MYSLSLGKGHSLVMCHYTIATARWLLCACELACFGLQCTFRWHWQIFLLIPFFSHFYPICNGCSRLQVVPFWLHVFSLQQLVPRYSSSHSSWLSWRNYGMGALASAWTLPVLALVSARVPPALPLVLHVLEVGVTPTPPDPPAGLPAPSGLPVHSGWVTPLVREDTTEIKFTFSRKAKTDPEVHLHRYLDYMI